MLSLRAIDTSGQVTQAIYLNATFWIPMMSNSYRLNPVPIPRAHGDRLPDTTFLAGKAIAINGVIGTGRASGEVGSSNRTSSGGSVLGIVHDTTNAAAYLEELRAAMARLHQQRTVILDLGNGWFHYVKTQMLQELQDEGFPDTRMVSLVVYAGDPIAYQGALAAAFVPSGYGQTAMAVTVGGYHPSSNYVFDVALPLASTANRVRIHFTHSTDDIIVSPIRQTSPDSHNRYTVIDGYRHTIYDNDRPSTARWDRWDAASRFPVLFPNGTSIAVFFDADTGAAINVSSDVLVPVFQARGADPIGHTVTVPALVPSSAYGTASYGVDLYG